MKNRAVNFSSLVAVQVANAIIPIIVFPLALSTIGSESYSLLVQSEVFSVILLAIVVYSFDVDGVIKVSGMNLQDNRNQISTIFSNVTVARIVLFLTFSPFFLFFSLLLDQRLVAMVAGWLLIPLSFAIHPGWLFLALEKNLPSAVFTVASRIIALLLVTLYVRSPEQAFLIPLFVGGAYLLGAVLCLLYVVHVMRLKLTWPPMEIVLAMLSEGKEIFMGNMCVVIYRDLNVLLLGLVGVNSSGVAAYSIAEKFVKAIQASLRPLNQLFTPIVIKNIIALGSVSNKKIFIVLLKFTMPQVFVCTFLITAVNVLIFLEPAKFDVMGPLYDAILQSSTVLGGMSFAIVFGVCNYMFGVVGLNVAGLKREFLRALFLTSIISLCVCFLASTLYGEYGAGFAFVFSEVLLLSFVLYQYMGLTTSSIDGNFR